MKNPIPFLLLSVAFSLAAADFNEPSRACLAESNTETADSILSDNDNAISSEILIPDTTDSTVVMDEYSYFFGYLPQIASQAPSPADFMDVKMMNSLVPMYNNLSSPFADTDITAEEIEVKGKDMKVVVWTFPMPTQMPMCLYMAFVADDKGGCRAYTLEKSIGTWFVGAMENGSHANFGESKQPADAAGFVKILSKKKLLK